MIEAIHDDESTIKPVERKIPATLEISAYLHCRKCIEEMPSGTSPEKWARISAGWTDLGLQLWCVRHKCNIMHVDFQGNQHPANFKGE